MKSTGNVNGKRVEWESKCFGGRKFYRPPKMKNGLSIKSSNLWKKPQVIKPYTKVGKRNGLEAGEGQTVRVKETGKTTSKRDTEKNKKKQKDTMEKLSSGVLYKRRFSKYTKKLRGKLGAKFKSSYKLSGKYDEPSTRYKSYVVDKDKSNKVSLKYSMCSVSLRRGGGKKKRKCPDLPAPGTYNHRFVYDEASRLRKRGKDVGVLYKVKDKDESTYLVNGEFKGKRKILSSLEESARRLRKNRKSPARDKVRPANTLEDRLVAEDLERKRLMDEELKRRAEKTVEIERQKEEKERKLKIQAMERKARQREAAKKLRTDALNKLQEARDLKEEKRRKHELLTSEEQEKNKQSEPTREEDENGLREMQRLQRLRLEALKQNVINNINKCDNITGNNGAATRLRYCGCEVPQVEDQTVLERWVLRNDGNLSAMSWLRLVTRRTNCLERQVTKELRDRWLRMAIDVVVDCMVQKKRTACCNRHDMADKKFMGKCAFRESSVCKPRKPCNCQHHTTVKLGKCKYIDIPGSVYYKPMKSKEGNYYEVMNMIFTATLSKDMTIPIDQECVGKIRSKNKYRLGIPNLYKYLLKCLSHIFG